MGVVAREDSEACGEESRLKSRLPPRMAAPQRTGVVSNGGEGAELDAG
jgi:hypothetical protein